jgi:staphyloferrin B biosynthesis citrate synthase
VKPTPARPFRSRVLEGERLLGTFMKMPTDHVVHILAQEGFDFVVIDEEHSAFNPETTDRLLAACMQAGIAGVVRVCEIGQVLRVLDCGAAGVLVPHVDTVPKAQAVAAAGRYRKGGRGFSNTTRAGRFGLASMADHIAAQDADVAVIAMIEDPSAIGVIDAIAAVEGIDGFFIGRGDLTVAYGVENQTAAEVRAAVKTITEAAARVGRRIFVLSASPEDAAELGRMGATGFLTATDHGLLRHGAKAAHDQFTAALQQGKT